MTKTFERVLIPTVFSRDARKVLECVGDVPGIKEVILFHAVARGPIARLWDPVAEARDAAKRLEAERQYIGSSGITVETRAAPVLENEEWTAIEGVADEAGADLVAMGARGRGVLESALLGSVSRDVLRFGDHHLLLMRYKILGGDLGRFCSNIFFKVLLPTDFSQTSDAAISLIKNMGGVGEVVLLHVISRGEARGEIDDAMASAQERLKAVAEDLTRSGMRVTSRVAAGNPVEVIRTMAEDEDVSLVALSSHGERAVRRGEHIGSTAYDVANRSSRPVLVIRADRVLYT